MASVAELTTKIKKQRALVLQLAQEVISETDPFECEKKLIALDGAREELTDFRLEKSLARCIDSCVDHCISAADALTEKLKRQVFAKLEEFEARISDLEGNSCHDDSENDLRQTVKQLVKGFHEVRTTLDAVDNRTRQSNVIIHGINGCNPLAEAKKLLKVEEDSSALLQTAHFIGKKNKNGTRPLLVKFATHKAKNNFVAHSRDKKFRCEHPRLSVVQEESYLRRVGASRLAAAAPALKDNFPNIKIRSRFVKFRDERIDAARFASDFVMIDAEYFDINMAIELNHDYEFDPSFCVQSVHQLLT